jgi:hypothetical protein
MYSAWEAFGFRSNLKMGEDKEKRETFGKCLLYSRAITEEGGKGEARGIPQKRKS